ncbi:unnamed protein product, partial [Thlaspi arvense]
MKEMQHSFPYIHKVGVPRKQTFLKELKATVQETFFADDPLRPFKDQPKSRKFILGLQAIFPFLNGLNFRGDLIAGLTIASLCIPQDIGYAKLANLDPQYGLYNLFDSSFVPPLIYAFMGSSRDIAIGPVAVVSLLLGTLLTKEIDPTQNAAEYLRLVFTATFFAGITQATLGFLRLGFLIDFLSHAAVVGFMAGAAITIALQQLKGFLGIEDFTKKTDVVSVMRSVFDSIHHGWNWQTIVIGATFLAFLLFTKYIGKKNKRLFWLPAIAPLISVVLSTFFVYITRADKQGVQIVKHIKKGINPPSVDKIYFDGDNLQKGFKIGVVAGSCSNRKNICFHEGLSARWKQRNGCQTAVSNIVMSCVVFLTLEFITPLFKYTPNAILSSIIISAVIGLIDFEAAILIWKTDKLDFIACLGAFFGVVFVSVEIGLLIAVSISFAKILLQVTRPRIAILGRVPRTNVYRNIQQYPEATKVPGILIVRVDSAIYFSNSNYVRERILRWLSDEEDLVKKACQPKIQFLIIEMSPIADIDTTGIHALQELHNNLRKRDLQFPSLIGEDKIFLTVADAVATCSTKRAEEVVVGRSVHVVAGGACDSREMAILLDQKRNVKFN